MDLGTRDLRTRNLGIVDLGTRNFGIMDQGIMDLIVGTARPTHLCLTCRSGSTFIFSGAKLLLIGCTCAQQNAVFDPSEMRLPLETPPSSDSMTTPAIRVADIMPVEGTRHDLDSDGIQPPYSNPFICAEDGSTCLPCSPVTSLLLTAAQLDRGYRAHGTYSRALIGFTTITPFLSLQIVHGRAFVPRGTKPGGQMAISREIKSK